METNGEDSLVIKSIGHIITKLKFMKKKAEAANSVNSKIIDRFQGLGKYVSVVD